MKFSMIPRKPRETFSLSKFKVVGYVLIVCFLMVILLSRGVTGAYTPGEAATVAGIALALIAYLVFILAPYLKQRGVILRVTPEGLIDLRKGPEPLAWEKIEAVDVKRLSIGPSLRLQLTDGQRYDLDFHLLDGRPEQCFLAMRPYLQKSQPDEA